MFNTKIPLYGVMIILSLLSNVIVIIFTYNKKTFTKNELIGALVYENIGIIFGAKIFSYLEHINKYESFEFLKIGISSYGGLIGGLIMLTMFAFQFKKSIKEMLLTFMPSIPLMYALGKIGCFLVGCCHGIEYNGIFHVTYNFSQVANPNTPYVPVQLLESLFFIAIFIYIIFKTQKQKLDLNSLGKIITLCGLSKFILDFLRDSHIRVTLSTNQMLSIVFIIMGLIMIIKNQKCK